MRNGNSRLSEEAALRKPRFFFVTTSSVTSTFETASVCYVTAGTGFTGECSGRKKRSNFRMARLPGDTVLPSQPTRENELESSEAEPSSPVLDGREGRFLLYWITTTSRSTTTTYTTTYSILSVVCTTPGSKECAGK